MTQQHWFYFSLFVTGATTWNVKTTGTNHPTHHFTWESHPDSRCVLQENICSGEKEETVSTEPPPPRLPIKTSHPSQCVSLHTVAQWSVVCSKGRVCALKWKPFLLRLRTGLAGSWLGWVEVISSWIRQAERSKQTSKSSNFSKLTDWHSQWNGM